MERGSSRTIVLLLGFSPMGVFGQNIASLLDSADRKHEINDFQANHTLLKEAEKVEPENVELLWRLARAHFDFSDNSEDEEVIGENVYAGFSYAERALKLDENHPRVHKFYGILVGRVGEIEGTEQKIRNSYKVAEHTLRAIGLDPADDGNYHVMGRWHYALADLNWFERTIAGLVYARPPEASFDQARDYFRKAVERATKSLDDVRIAEVIKEDIKIEGGKITAFRTKLQLSFKFKD